MVAVFDASVLAKLYLPEPDATLAEHVVAHFRLVTAPDLVRWEVASAITRAARNGKLHAGQARERLDDWRRFAGMGNVRFAPFDRLQPRAEHWSLELRHPLADCVYLTLAEETNAPLVTADGPFADKARTVLPTVRHLSEFGT